MTSAQRVIKYLAIALALFLVVNIAGGILSVVGLIGGAFGGDAVAEEVKSYDLSSNITSIELEIGAAALTIKEADSFSLESNLKHLTVTERDGVLIIKEKEVFGGANYTGAVLTLTLPYLAELESAQIKTGAGRLNIERLSAEDLTLELGAGEVNIGSLTAHNSANVDGGAGKVTVSGGALRDLDLDMGVGQLDLTSLILGDSELDLGVGESNITLIGNRDDYTVSVEKGIGAVIVDGEGVSDSERIGNGGYKLDINGGVGAINIRFAEN